MTRGIGIVNKGEGSFLRLSPAMKFTHGGYESTPLSLTNYTANHYGSLIASFQLRLYINDK